MSQKEEFIESIEKFESTNCSDSPVFKFMASLRDKLMLSFGFSRNDAETIAFIIKIEVDNSFDDELINRTSAAFATIINKINDVLIAYGFNMSVVDYIKYNNENFNIKYLE